MHAISRIIGERERPIGERAIKAPGATMRAVASAIRKPDRNQSQQSNIGNCMPTPLVIHRSATGVQIARYFAYRGDVRLRFSGARKHIAKPCRSHPATPTRTTPLKIRTAPIAFAGENGLGEYHCAGRTP